MGEITVENQTNESEIENTNEVEAPETEDDTQEPIEEEVVVTIGEDSPPQKEETPPWVKDLRKQNRENAKRIRDLEKENKTLKGDNNKDTILRAKPNLEHHDFDQDSFNRDLDNWIDERDDFKKSKSKKEAQKLKEEQAWQDSLKSYEEKKKLLNVQNFDEAEEVVRDTLSETQQGILLDSAENPALVAYALGSNIEKIRELSSIKSPIKFAASIARLEKDLRVSNRKKAPAPEKIVKGGSPLQMGDSILDKLRAESEKTGDYSKVIEYKKKKE